MSQVDATEILTFLDELIKGQEKTLLDGATPVGAQITRIEEYRAGVMLRRSMQKLRRRVQDLVDGRTAAELAEEASLTEMPEEDDKT